MNWRKMAHPIQRFVDEHSLPRRKHGLDLLQMRSAIDAFQEHGIDFAKQLVDRIDNLNLELIAQHLGIAGQAVATGGDVGAAPRVCGHDLDSRNVSLGIGVVQFFREGHHVRRIKTNNADLDRPLVGRVDKRAEGKRNRKEEVEALRHGASLMGWEFGASRGRKLPRVPCRKHLARRDCSTGRMGSKALAMGESSGVGFAGERIISMRA
jgi:hypothetical protein